MSASLVPLRTRTVVQSPSATGAIVSKTALTPAVQSGIKSLLVAFAVGPVQHEDDRIHLIRADAGAVDGFEIGVVQHVLGYLLYHNPRNPFRPSPQDVFELCEETTKVVRFFAARFQLLFVFGLNSPEENDVRDLAADHWDSKWGARPDEEGCIISRDSVMAEVRTIIQRHERALIRLPDEKFAAIPLDAFSDNYRNKIIMKRDQHAYELGLYHEERVARYFVLDQSRRDGLQMDEAEIRRRTTSRLNSMRENRGAASA